MIQSMTGYGKACAQCGLRKVHVEIKSLNSKSLDLSTRIAPLYREKEMEIRTAVAQRLERGKVDFTLWVEKDESPTGCLINGSMVKHYLKQIEEISQANGIAVPTANAWDILVRLPDLTYPAVTEELAAEEWTAVQGVIGEALDRLVEFRTQEGAALERKFTDNLDIITAEKIRARLEEHLAELRGVDYDRGRLEQELIYYIEKLDISEEKQRLTNHLKYFRETMASGHGQGKKLGFIAQEMGREINTTGSKSNQAEMQNIVVRMKDELEQIKEQVLNVM